MIPIDREGEGYPEIHQFAKMNSASRSSIIANLEVPKNGDLQ
jgi:hypothetical protein